MHMRLFKDLNPFQQGISRRGFLTFALFTAVANMIPDEAIGAIKKTLASERSLSLYNTHTGEKLKSVYWSKGKYVPQALVEVNRLLRDHRTGDVKKIDPSLLDLLHVLHRKLDSRTPFHIISGYRSARTNSFLRQRHQGVAKNSLHTIGKAVDIYLPGRNLKTLLTAAVDLKGGGVGYYPESNFVHVDVGRVRYW